MSLHPDTAIVILAAGEGTRMGSHIPKVMHELTGKPLVEHVVGAAVESGVDERPVVVVPRKHSLVQDHLGNRVRFCIQDEPLGTGHAVLATRSMLEGAAEHVLILYADMPFIRPQTVKRLAHIHRTSGAAVSMLTAQTPDFDGWRAAFKTFGRVVRDSAGSVRRIVEYKDASAEELSGRELSTCFFCFRADWLWDHIERLAPHNAQNELYLVDLIAMAIDEHERVECVPVDLREVMGINEREDLERARHVWEEDRHKEAASS